MADVVVDTNIWCYYFDHSTNEHPVVVKYMDRLFETKTIAINVIILIECAHYLIKNLGSVIGKEKLDLLISSGIEIADLTLYETMSSIDNLSKYTHIGIGGRDATILTCMEKLGVKELITHDKSFQKINKINVTDPIEDSN